MTSGQVAKQRLVEDSGIGEDIPFTFIGWDDDVLVTMMSLGPEAMAMEVGQRMPLVGAITEVMRKIYKADSLTFIAEGFISRDAATRGKDLRAIFAAGNEQVMECLSVCHVEINNFGEPDCTVISAPYSYVDAKNVAWYEMSYYEHGVGRVLRDSPFIAMMALNLMSEAPSISEEDYMAALDALMMQGCLLHEFRDPEIDDDSPDGLI